MPVVDVARLDVFLLEDAVWLIAGETGLPSYDFAFEHFFACRHPWQRPESVEAIGRFGASTNYAELYAELMYTGISLVHTPEQQLLASELPRWYPLIAPLTPRSAWFAEPPSVEVVEALFTWPIFVKGSRQTSRHQVALAIAHTPDDYRRIAEHYRRDPILRWQALVCREFIPLRRVAAAESDTIPPAFEFRTFWWRGRCVGAGPYWASFAAYAWTHAEERAALAIAAEAARRVDLPFLVVDVAQTAGGEWIVIECNDGQESGYAGVSPFALWQNIVDIERGDRGE
jgi:hypothetical protein